MPGSGGLVSTCPLVYLTSSPEPLPQEGVPRGKLFNHLVLAKPGCPKALDIQASTGSPQPREYQLLGASTKQEGEEGESVMEGFPFSERQLCSQRAEKEIRTQGPAPIPLY